MALKVELKPHERIIVGTALIRNTDQRVRILIEGEAPILREKDIFTSVTADTVAKRIYLAIQLMYLKQSLDDHNTFYFPLVREFLQAAPSAVQIIANINNRILSGDLYKALKEAKRLIEFETELLSHAQRGARLRESSSEHSVPTGSGSDSLDEGGKPSSTHS